MTHGTVKKIRAILLAALNNETDGVSLPDVLQQNTEWYRRNSENIVVAEDRDIDYSSKPPIANVDYDLNAMLAAFDREITEINRVLMCAHMGIRMHFDPEQTKKLAAEISELLTPSADVGERTR